MASDPFEDKERLCRYSAATGGLLNISSIIDRNRLILAEARFFIFAGIFLFLAGAVIGYTRPAQFMELLGGLYSMAERLHGSSAPMIIFAIFIQNASAALLAVWLGLIFGIVPIVSIVANGILLGVVMTMVDNGLTMAIGLIPHGVFELPAIFIAWGLGIWRGMWLFHGKKKETYENRARKAYLVFFTLVIPLLVMAAIIEGIAIAMLT
jgi:stage II sporulation protein M